MNIEITTETAKAMARRLRAFLDERPDGPFRHAHALEAVARMLGEANWNTLAARLASATPPAGEATDDASTTEQDPFKVWLATEHERLPAWFELGFSGERAAEAFVRLELDPAFGFGHEALVPLTAVEAVDGDAVRVFVERTKAPAAAVRFFTLDELHDADGRRLDD